MEKQRNYSSQHNNAAHLKTYCKTAGSRQGGTGDRTNRPVEQIATPEIDSHKYRQPIFDKGSKQHKSFQ